MPTVDITTTQTKATLHIKKFDIVSYDAFLKAKALPRYNVLRNGEGFKVEFPVEYVGAFDKEPPKQQESMPFDLPDFLFDRQQVCARVGWQKKRYAFFLDAGLGKTMIFAELARQLVGELADKAANQGKKVLIVSPLNVVSQTLEEILRFYGSDYPHIVNLHSRSSKSWLPKDIQEFVKSDYTIAIVNHEYFIRERDLSGIDCLILDESSILKASHGKISSNLIDGSKGIEYKFCFSATPAPNDRVEYARHAMLLEMVRSETEFLARFFVQKDRGWTMRRHAKDKFYKFLASWSIFIRHPEAYGLESVDLPPYQEIQELVPMTQDQIDLISTELNQPQMTLNGMPTHPKGWSERQLYNQVSKGFMYVGPSDNREVITVPSNKPKAIRDFLLRYPGEKAIVWTVYDEEGEILLDELETHTQLRIVHLTGKTPLEKRAGLIDDFRHGKIDVIISKPRILGLGLNLHVASIQVWSGLRDSFEFYYQGIKRSWRYPQDKTVKIYLPYTEYEKAILDNVLRKRDEAEKDYAIQEALYTQSLYDEIQAYLESDFVALREEKEDMVYDPVITERYQLYHTDSVRATLDGLAENSVDLAVFSPPFPADIFAYTNHIADMGNTGGVGVEGNDEYLTHLFFCLTGVYKTLKPGRICAIEISQSPRRLQVDGVIGMYDTRGDIIRTAESVGFYQVGEWPVLGNPQAEAIVKHISCLNMNHVRNDRAKLAPMINDYILIFRKPGENEAPITNQIEYFSINLIADLFDIEASKEGFHYHGNLLVDEEGYEYNEKDWREFELNPAKNEWSLMEIDGALYVRDEHLISDLMYAKAQGYEPPSYVKEENDEWLVPVERAWLNNEQWIEYADGIAQKREFNRTATMATSVKQKERFGNYLDQVQVQYNAVRDFITGIEAKVAKGEITEKEILSMFAGAFLDIDQTDTLNTPYTRGRTKEVERSDKHVCPFSIPLVNRLIRMYSNPGEIVLDCFMGVGTVPKEALELERKAIGMEIKSEYFIQAVDICEKVSTKPKQLSLF